MVYCCATILQDAPELFQNLNDLLSSRDGEDIVISGTDETKGRIEIAMAISHGKGYMCQISDDAQTQKPAFMDSVELRFFLYTNTFYDVSKYMATITRRWAPFVMELLQLLINESPTDSSIREECIIYMRYLSWSHRALPFTFYISGVTRVGDHPVSAGGFSDIWKGRLGATRVCIKVLRFFSQTSTRDDTMEDLISEVLLLRQLRHPNILSFLGVNGEVLSPSFAIITPWMTHDGDLSLSQPHRASINRYPFFGLDHQIRQVVKGLHYLHTHSPPVIHCDIKAANVFVSEDEQCCIGDFGLSILEKTQRGPIHVSVTESLGEKSGVRGSLRWLAPELLHPNRLSQSDFSRDIYALGCTILEVFSGHPPFHDERSEVKIMIQVLSGQRPGLPPGVRSPSILWHLIETCWLEDANARPDAAKVLEVLDEWIGLGYDELPQFPKDEKNWETLLPFADSDFDARQLCNPSGTDTPLAEDHTNEAFALPSPIDFDFASDVETETACSEWSDEDTDCVASAPQSPFNSSVYSLPKNVDDETEGVDTCRLLLTKAPFKELGKARSEPVFPFRLPKGSVWNSLELQSAWSGYMGRRRLAPAP
ncbi:Protein kinase of the Mitotic Exit Network [Marasmius tenuissimus]|uniref:Protein kinase of the Mitotic Exit Network n=1 Tax=Marasmius tenuissimus TaxID=585030 RepID=A0ABR3A306_9AGAR